MRLAVLPLLGLAGIAAWSQQAAPPAQDELLRAMHDELDRARQMRLPNLEPPYFVQYLLDREETFTVSASLGGLLSQRRETIRQPQVTIRVGDYQFDNTNYMGSGFNFGGLRPCRAAPNTGR